MERIVVTSALIYSNGEPHLGHLASTYLPADVFVRFCRLQGKEVYHVSGTDDYGVPILIKAEQEGKDPEELVKYWWEQDKVIFERVGIHFDIFHRTHSPEHVKLAQRFFKTIRQKGFVYEKRIEQFYDKKAKKFLPDRYVRGTCPYCKAPNQYGDGCEKCGKVYEATELLEPRSALSGEPPIRRKSVHYFFKLSAFTSQLERWLKENQNLQPEVKRYVLGWIESGLRDWDITRDISWGVPIPLEGAEGKVLYGWFENHIGYITFALKLKRSRQFWNSSKIYHFIGKDIVYHHYLFLPAVRLAEGNFKPPDFIPVRGHLLLQGQKFSKSRGWYVSIEDFLNHFPPDYLRFYLTLITPHSQADVNFDWKDFQAKVNGELVDNLGNFVHRCLSFLWKHYNGVVPEPELLDSKSEERKERLLEGLRETVERAGQEYSSLNFQAALKCALKFAKQCNAYFQAEQPWAKERRACLFLCVNALRTLAVILYPVIPSGCERLWAMLNLEEGLEEQGWQSATQLLIRPGHKIKEPQPLFKKVEDREIRLQLERLRQAELPATRPPED